MHRMYRFACTCFVAALVVGTATELPETAVEPRHQLPPFDLIRVEPESIEHLLQHMSHRLSTTTGPAPSCIRLTTMSGAGVLVSPSPNDNVVMLPAVGSIPARVCVIPSAIDPPLDILAASPLADASLGLPRAPETQPRAPTVFEKWASDEMMHEVWREVNAAQCWSEKTASRGITYQLCPLQYVRRVHELEGESHGGAIPDGVLRATVFGRYDEERSKLHPLGDHFVSVYPNGDPCPRNSPDAATGSNYEAVVYYRCATESTDGDADHKMQKSWYFHEYRVQCRAVVTFYLRSVCAWAVKQLDAQSLVVPCTEIDDDILAASDFPDP